MNATGCDFPGGVQRENFHFTPHSRYYWTLQLFLEKSRKKSDSLAVFDSVHLIVSFLCAAVSPKLTLQFFLDCALPQDPLRGTVPFGGEARRLKECRNALSASLGLEDLSVRVGRAGRC